MTTKVQTRKTKIVERISTVNVRLPNPLPSGLKVVYWEEIGGYTIAASSKTGVRNLLRLGMAGRLG